MPKRGSYRDGLKKDLDEIINVLDLDDVHKRYLCAR